MSTGQGTRAFGPPWGPTSAPSAEPPARKPPSWPPTPADLSYQRAHEHAAALGVFPEVVVRARHTAETRDLRFGRVLEGFTVFVQDAQGRYHPALHTAIAGNCSFEPDQPRSSCSGCAG